MKRTLEGLDRETWDLVVIGGGISGAGVLAAAVQAGLRTLLLEKNDFASGTSSKSTRLIHGGLRYLEHFEFSHVMEALRERDLLLRAFPGLASPEKFILPIYKNWKRPAWYLKTGVFLYDLLAGSKRIQPHRSLSTEDVQKIFPGIQASGLQGGIQYHDARCSVERMILRLILYGTEHGGRALNYAPVNGLERENNGTWNISLLDIPGKNTLVVRAHRIVNASGPWVDRVLENTDGPMQKRIRPTRGAHVFLPNPGLNSSLITVSAEDARVFFMIPHGPLILVGTTDIDEPREPQGLTILDREVNYLLDGIKTYFPNFSPDAGDILYSMVGVRPLIYIPGKPADAVSRRHKIIDHRGEGFPGLYSLAGGKLTTFRVMAEECLQKILPRGQGFYFRLPLFNEERLDSYPSVRKAVEYEMALSIEDVLRRRMHDPFACLRDEKMIKFASAVLSDHLHWDQKKRDEEIQKFLKKV